MKIKLNMLPHNLCIEKNTFAVWLVWVCRMVYFSTQSYRRDSETEDFPFQPHTVELKRKLGPCYAQGCSPHTQSFPSVNLSHLNQSGESCMIHEEGWLESARAAPSSGGCVESPTSERSDCRYKRSLKTG